MGTLASSCVTSTMHGSGGRASNALSPFRCAFAIDVTALEQQPSALRRAAAIVLRDVVARGGAIALERTGTTLTVRRFDARAAFHQGGDVVETYPLAFGVALRETVAQLVAINPESFHEVTSIRTEGSLRHVAHIGSGEFAVRSVRVCAGIATARHPGHQTRRALVIRPLAAEN